MVSPIHAPSMPCHACLAHARSAVFCLRGGRQDRAQQQSLDRWSGWSGLPRASRLPLCVCIHHSARAAARNAMQCNAIGRRYLRFRTATTVVAAYVGIVWPFKLAFATYPGLW